MKTADLIKVIMNCAFILAGIYGLIYGDSPVFFAILILLSSASLFVSLKLKKDTNVTNTKSGWDDSKDKEKQ